MKCHKCGYKPKLNEKILLLTYPPKQKCCKCGKVFYETKFAEKIGKKYEYM